MDLDECVLAVGALWQVETAGWHVVVSGETATVHLPAAGAVVHLARGEVTSSRVEALQTARARLAESQIPVVSLLPSVAGATWEQIDGRVVEVEQWVQHDGRMNTWARLRRGAALLARVHNAWSDLDLGPDGEACTWANWISAPDAVTCSEHAAHQLSKWGFDELAASVVRLAELTADDHVLPMQVVHGDFWDNNIYVRDERLIAVTDFDFLGRRPRIDDLALMLYFADEQPYFDGSGPRSVDTRIAEIVPLVRSYADHLSVPLTPEEIGALPAALARQPLWTYGKWLLRHPDGDQARRDALDTTPAVSRALEIMTQPDRWTEAFNPTT